MLAKRVLKKIIVSLLPEKKVKEIRGFLKNDEKTENDVGLVKCFDVIFDELKGEAFVSEQNILKSFITGLLNEAEVERIREFLKTDESLLKCFDVMLDELKGEYYISGKRALRKIIALSDEAEIEKMRGFLATDKNLLKYFDATVDEMERMKKYEQSKTPALDSEKIVKDELKALENGSTHLELIEKYCKEKGWEDHDLYRKLGMAAKEWLSYKGYHGYECSVPKKSMDTAEQHSILLRMCILFELDIDSTAVFMGVLSHGFGHNGVDTVIKDCIMRKEYNRSTIQKLLKFYKLEPLYWSDIDSKGDKR